MHLQENILFDLDLRSWNIAQYPLHHVIYAPALLEGNMSNI